MSEVRSVPVPRRTTAALYFDAEAMRGYDQMSVTERILGIDLGTTNSVMAIIEGEIPEIVPNAEGQNRTPSVVSFLPNGEIVVGEIARRQAATNVAGTVFSIKRLMGRSPDQLGDDLDFFASPIVEADGLAAINIGGENRTAPEISALILSKLKRDAEAHLGEEIERAIVTVPAYFDDLQRQATIEAGRLAGLEILRIINEPTAAAMAYGLNREVEERIAVFDCGGGTFDLSILDISKGAFEVVTSLGDSHLGGDDIDHAIVDLLIEQFHKQQGVDLGEDDVAMRRLKEAAEKAKCELSGTMSTVISLPFIAQAANGNPLHLEMSLTRNQLEDILIPYVQRCLDCCQQALTDAQLTIREIDRVILVGGSTRIPLIQEAVEDFFGLTPHRGVNPDEIVALGAATQGGVMSGALEEVILLEVTPLALGVETKGDSISTIIEKNSTIPIKAEKVFTTTQDDQTLVNIHVIQGEAELASDGISLGKFSLTDITPAKAGYPRIKVSFQINADGVVEIEARDLASSHSESLRIVHTFDPHRPQSSPGDDTPGAQPKRPNRWRQRRRRALDPVSAANETITGVPLRIHHSDHPDHSGLELTANSAGGVDFAASPLAETPVPVAMAAPPKDGEEIHARTSDMEATLLSASAIGTDGPLASAQRFLQQGVDDTIAQSTYRAAVPLLEERIQADPKDNRGKLLLGEILLVLHEHTAARGCFQALLEECPTELPAVRLAYDRFLARMPQVVDVRVDRAHILGRLGDIDRAIEDLESLSDTDKKKHDVVQQLISLYRQKVAGASDPAVQFKLIKLHLQRNDLDEAISLLQRLINHSSYAERAGKILGLCFWQKHMHHLAWQRFRTLPINAEIKDILLRLSQDMEAAEDYVTAKQVLEHVYAVDINFRDVAERIKSNEEKIKTDKARQSPGPIFTPPAGPESQIDDVRFTIMGEINRGSMGVIYRAKDNVLDEIVALKVLNAFLCADPQAVDRFKREARAAKRLSHPNIVRIHDMFEKGNKKFLSMEYIDGSDLKSIVKTQGRIEPDEVIRIAQEICQALAHGHKMKIIHRDIKPANIMITQQTRDVKITDYGIAKTLTGDNSGTGTMVMGTPLYMAPEQVEGTSIDARTDLYSLGVLMFELTTGKPPFLDGNIEYHHVNTLPPDPVPCPKGLRDVIMRCLEKNPADRFQSAQELIAQLKGLELTVSDSQ